MVKNKESMFSYLKVLYNSNVFSKNISNKKSIYYFGIYTFLIGLFSVIENLANPNRTFGSVVAFLQGILGMVVVVLILHTLTFILINSYEVSKKKFWDSYFVFGVISLPFFVLGHLFTLLLIYSYSNFILNTAQFVINALVFYLLIMLFGNLKSYYNVSGYRIAGSFIITGTLILLLGVIGYLVTIMPQILKLLQF